MLVILFDMEDDSAGKLYLGQEVEISENEEDFALRLELSDHELLISEKIIFLVLFSRVHIVVLVTSKHNLILSELSISERENIVAALDYMQGEVQIGQLEIDVSDLALCLRLGGCSCIRCCALWPGLTSTIQLLS